MKTHPFLAHLSPTSPFRDIFPAGVPIRGFMLSQVELVDIDPLAPPVGRATDVYFVAWQALDAGTKTRLASRVARERGGWVHEFLDYMQDGGDLPLRASQVESVSCTLPFFLE